MLILPRSLLFFSFHAMIALIFVGIFLVVSFLDTCVATAQTSEIDSLRRTLASLSEMNHQKAWAWNRLAYNLYKINASESLKYADSALQLAQKIRDTLEIANAHRNRGRASWVMGKYSIAQEEYKLALDLFKRLGEKDLISGVLNNLGNIHRAEGNYSLALEQYLQALKIAEEGNTDDAVLAQGFAMNNIGNIYFDLQRFDDAILYHKKTVELGKKVQHLDKLALCLGLSNIGVTLAKQKKHSEAVPYLLSAIQELETTSFREDLANVLKNLTDSYAALGKHQEAIVCGERSLSIAESIPAKRSIADASRALADAYLAAKKSAKSLEYALRSIRVSEEIHHQEKLLNALKSASRASDELGQYDDAMRYLQRFIVVNDSIYKNASAKAIAQLQTQYDVEKREQRIQFLQKEKELQDSQHERDIVIRNALGLGVIVLIAIVGLAAYLYRVKHETELQLRKQQDLLERANAELTEANLFKVQMLSIAAHDLKNPLGAITGFAELLESSPLDDTETRHIVLQNIKELGVRMLHLVNNILDAGKLEMGKLTLVPQKFSLSYLVVSAAEQFLSAAMAKGQTINLDIASDCNVVGDEERLRQVLDNLVSNAVKYSPHGKTIAVRLQPDTLGKHDSKQSYIIEVQDEGPGFSDEDKTKLFGFFQRLSARPTGGESSNGVGLAIVKNIVEAHQGEISVQSELGKGTTFRVRLPL